MEKEERRGRREYGLLAIREKVWRRRRRRKMGFFGYWGRGEEIERIHEDF